MRKTSVSNSGRVLNSLHGRKGTLNKYGNICFSGLLRRYLSVSFPGTDSCPSSSVVSALWADLSPAGRTTAESVSGLARSCNGSSPAL